MEKTTGEIVDDIIALAFRMGASDVHFDPVGDELVVRLRIHGRMIDASSVVAALPRTVARSAVQRLKVLARMSVGEHRRPQDGQLHMALPGGDCDLRVGTMPTVRGERLVARLIPAHVPWDDVGSLGMSAKQAQQVVEAITQAGLIVVAGRIGSGKSTTMHALLFERSRGGASVLSIEDPVERHIATFQQVEVDERRGLTFAECLRAALRQDPDVLMVGEMRDEATAQVAVRAGMTGHLIITSIHADHPTQVVSRLLEFGVHQRFVHEVMRLIIWQRLLPTPCETCAGTGCPQCFGLGVTGRRAEFRLLTTADIAPLLSSPPAKQLSLRTGQQVPALSPCAERSLYVEGSNTDAVVAEGRKDGRGDFASEKEASLTGYGVFAHRP